MDTRHKYNFNENIMLTPPVMCTGRLNTTDMHLLYGPVSFRHLNAEEFQNW